MGDNSPSREIAAALRASQRQRENGLPRSPYSLAMAINFDFYASYRHGNFNEPRIALYLFDGQRYFVAVYIEFLLISVQIGGNRFG